MDIKPTNVAIPPAVLTPQARPRPLPQRPTPCTGPIAPEDVIDCGEIRAGESPQPRKIALPRGAAEKSLPAKGSLIDIRI